MTSAEAAQTTRPHSDIVATRPMTRRKRTFLEETERTHLSRQAWVDRNGFFHNQDLTYLRFIIPEGLRVLELGCGAGHALAGVRPEFGVGVDLSPTRITEARSLHPHLTFIAGDVEDPQTIERLKAFGRFDVILLADTLGYVDDIQLLLESLHTICGRDTRVVVAYHSALWEPLIRSSERLGMKQSYQEVNYLARRDLASILTLSGFDLVKEEARQLIPRRLAGVGTAVNRWIAPLPLIRRLCLRHYMVARSMRVQRAESASCSVIVPCRNERGNIEAAVTRLPRFCDDLEIVFVEGHSSDGTWQEVLRVQAAYPERKIVTLQQTGKGKGDAVRAGFAAASGEILMILDADLTVPPEDLPKFYRAMVSGAGEFLNGTRLIYPLENQAMRFLNYWANRTFAVLFTYLLNQPYSDTLCGTKVLRKKAYDEIARNRSYFGDFDPFGDFDLIFGASRLGLKAVEIPVRYAARTYGTTQISRFTHGWLLLRMVLFAFRRLKAL